MDQSKIGRFIGEVRKEKSYTQRQLADILGISDKTVSKWETGNGLPEVSLMLPLCEALQISVNELLSGERLSDADYKRKAEENIMDLMEEIRENKKKVILSVVVVFITLLAAITILFIATEHDGVGTAERIILIVIGVIVMIGGLGVATALDINAGTYECRKCGKRFVPKLGSYLNGAHTITTRYLRCPECGKRSFCKRRLSR